MTSEEQSSHALHGPSPTHENPPAQKHPARRRSALVVNVHASHAVHASPSPLARSWYPATHAQSPNASLPSAEEECGGHAAQRPVPAAVLYSPTAHAAHPPRSAWASPVKPAPHWHASLPDADSEFAGHVEHSAGPGSDLNVPASHAEHDAPSDAPLCPGRHEQSSMPSLPAAEPVPAGHVSHAPAPVEPLCFPAAHAVHAPPSPPVYPATHRQYPALGLELERAGQAVQVPAPAAVLYSPAAHAAHAAPADPPLNPTMHVQSSSATLAEGERVPAGQVLHVAVPTAARYCP